MALNKRKQSRLETFLLTLNQPSVNSDVTPSVMRAGIASGFIQNEIHDMTTIRADGMYLKYNKRIGNKKQGKRINNKNYPD